MQEKQNAFRTEKDSLGEKNVPLEANFGIFTQRAFENFRISGLKAPKELLKAYISIKLCASQTNAQLGVLEKDKADAIVRACRELLAKPLHEDFPLDVFQAGAGTPYNMNANEVIANKATELLGGRKGEYLVHPNDHVNLSQSSNDVSPTAIRIAALWQLQNLDKNLAQLQAAFEGKSHDFADLLKAGRTHLQDALPITLGQEFSAFAKAVEKSRKRIRQSEENLRILGIGATALGTGSNAPKEYQKLMVENLAKETGLELKPADNLFEKTAFASDYLETAHALSEFAVDLNKICNDLRLLSSGPNTGFAEIVLPGVQPGSSIMPGKVNPSISEMANMVCYQVQGNTKTIELAAMNGELQLNVFTPVIAHNLLQSIDILANACSALNEKCVSGIQANEKKLKENFDKNLATATLLSPLIGYAKTAELVKEALRENKSLIEIVKEKKLLSEEKLSKLLSKEVLTMANLEELNKLK